MDARHPATRHLRGARHHWDELRCCRDHYIVTVYNHGPRPPSPAPSPVPATGAAVATGTGDHAFEVPGDAGPATAGEDLSSTYRGSGDQVFVLNPGGEVLDDTLYTLNLGDAFAGGVRDRHQRATTTWILRSRRDLREAAKGAAGGHAGRVRAATETGGERAGTRIGRGSRSTTTSYAAGPWDWIREHADLQAQSQRRVAEGDTVHLSRSGSPRARRRNPGYRPQGGHGRHDHRWRCGWPTGSGERPASSPSSA